MVSIDEIPSYIYGLMGNFGSLLIPVVYLLLVRGKGKLFKPYLIGFILQIVSYTGAYFFIFWCYRQGYSEWYWAYGLYILINFLGIIYYIGAALIMKFRKKQ
ncbi:MAG: hypothetical protein HYU97_08775 [Deltaproteobacteria bacterium]|nr:hypothetical protein [Deltaproteobacteria bacterium]